MKRLVIIVLVLLCIVDKVAAVQKIWVGGSTGSWTNTANWSPSGVPTPAANDTLVFDGALSSTVTITDVAVFTSSQSFGQFVAKNNITLQLSAAANTFLYFSGGIQINSGSRVNVGGSTATLFVIGGSTTTAGTTLIAGTLDLQGNGSGFSTRCSYEPHNAFTFNAVATVTGKIIMSGAQAQFANNNNGNFIFSAGSSLDVTRNGGVVPAANYQNGAIVTVSGVVAGLTTFSSGAIYNGQIYWNCPLQTINGSSSVLGFSSSYPTIDSFIVQSTGASGTIRLSTEMNPAPTFNNIRVEGGTLEIASPRANNRTMTINNTLTVTGGILTVNATDVTDNLAVYNMTVNVGGNVSVTGGTLLMSNRPPGSGGTYGVGNLSVSGNFIQSSGLINETTAVPSATDASSITMAGTAVQNLALTNWTNEVRLQVNNTTNGVSLQSNVSCPEQLWLGTAGSFISLNSYHLTVPAFNVFILYNNANPARIVTNGTGHLTYTNVTSGGTVVFPVTPVQNSISSVVLRNNGLVSNNFNVRVERGNNPGGIFNTGATVNRTWIINDAANSGANSIDLRFLYPDTALNAFCVRGGPMELGHYPVNSWNVDPVAVTRTPVQGGASPATDSTGFFAPNSLDSAFVLGNQFSILTATSGISMNYFKGYKQGVNNALTWAVNCTSNQAKFEIQRSSNGNSFTAIGNITASFNRCLQPFDFTDNNPLPGINYYRIKITDIDGTITYSTFVLLQSKACAPGTMQLLPTLVQQSNAVLCMGAARAGVVQLRITDINGRVLQTIKENITAGQNQFNFQLNNLPPGLYYITAAAEGQQWAAVRFVKL